MADLKYRHCTIAHDPPPISGGHYDYGWFHDDYSGPGDCRYGFGASVEACKVDIDDMHYAQETV